MKTIFRVIYVCLVSLFVGWLSVGCNDGSLESTSQGTCRIQQYISRSKASESTYLNQIDYVYDQQSNLSKTTTIVEQRPVSGTIAMQTGTTTVTYTYDSGGYLTASNSLQKTTNLFAGKTTVEQVSVVSSYSYANGRLASSSIRRVGAYGVNTTTAESYQYDSSGDLVKKTSQDTYDYDPVVAHEIPKSPMGALRTWTYQKNQLVDYVETYENAESRFLTIQNSVFTKITIPGDQGEYVATYDYDSQLRPIQWNEYVGGVLKRSYTQIWSDARPSSDALPSFKGWPLLIQEFGRAGVLATRKSFDLNTSTKQMEQYDEQTSVIQTNSQGLVTNNLISIKHPNSAAASQDQVITETYTYSGCQ